MREQYDRDYFDGTGSDYGAYRAEDMLRYFRPLAEGLLEATGAQRVVDLGCAKGYLVQAFREAGAFAVGVDVSAYALPEAPDGVRGYLARSDLEHDGVPFRAGSFDLAISSEVLEHIAKPERLIADASRVLRPGGLFVATTPAVEVKGHYDPTHVGLVDRATWVSRFRAAGFKLPAAGMQRRLRRVFVGAQVAAPPASGLGRTLARAGRCGALARRLVIELDVRFCLRTNLLMFTTSSK